MGQEVQVRISDINTDNNTVNLSMVPAGAYDDRSGGGYGEKRVGGGIGVGLLRFRRSSAVGQTCKCPVDSPLVSDCSLVRCVS